MTRTKICLFLVMIILFETISGCIEEKNNSEEVTTMEKISIMADTFKDGEAIPVEYTCDGKDISPALSWNRVPEDAKSIALIMDDPDAPRGTFVHWVIFNIPTNVMKLEKGISKNKMLGDGSLQGTNDFRKIGYGGPCPPSGTHRYYFRIYALDTKLDLPSGATRIQVDDAMKGHIITKGELMGRYRR